MNEKSSTFKFKIIESASMLYASIIIIFISLGGICMAMINMLSFILDGNQYVNPGYISFAFLMTIFGLIFGLMLDPIQYYKLKFGHNHLYIFSDNFWGLRKKNKKIKYSNIDYIEYSHILQELNIISITGDCISSISFINLKKSYKIKIINRIKKSGIKLRKEIFD